MKPGVTMIRRNPPETRYCLEIKRDGQAPKLFFGKDEDDVVAQGTAWHVAEGRPLLEANTETGEVRVVRDGYDQHVKAHPLSRYL